MGEAKTWPAYLELFEEGRLAELADKLTARLSECDLCPRLCKVNRIRGELGFCRGGERALVASYGPHYGEERPLVGVRGSGTIFFAGCNLGCIFCQNYDISHGLAGKESSPEELSEIMLQLQSIGCHNINLVTPTHFLPQTISALVLAVEGGLRLPLVYNCGGYELAGVLREMDGVVDIYMPDFKYWDEEVAERYSQAPDYPRRARDALREMHRQVGDLQVDDGGIARRGIILRHLVMPEGIAGTAEVAEFVAEEISKDTYFNLMDQYYPTYEASRYSQLSRRISRDEWNEALQEARRAGLSRFD